jgi:small-conductance mechanosensitive channel
MVVIPNSVASKAIVTNHSRPKGPHRCIIRLSVDGATAQARVIEALTAAVSGSPSIAVGTVPLAYACAFSDALIDYEVAFAIDSFAHSFTAKSEMIERIADSFRELALPIGAPAMAIRLIGQAARAADGAEAPRQG